MGNKQHGLLGCVGCFLVPALVRHPWWVVGVGAYFWVGHKSFQQMSTLSGSRSTPCERPPPVVVVVAHTASLKGFFFGCGLCVVGCL